MRMQDFVDYHIRGDGGCNHMILRGWADNENLGLQERYELSFLFSVTYCVISAIILFEEQRNGGCLYKYQAPELKRKILFQSDRKYMAMKDNFERCLAGFEDHQRVELFLAEVCDKGKLNLKKAIPYVSKWVMFGRFSAFLFLETFQALTGLGFINASIDWKNGNTATSGLLNIFGMDKAADAFDKTGRLPIEPLMDKMLAETLRQIEARGGDTNVTKVETSLCAYRKWFKGSRYDGYYLDRMLEELVKMKGTYPAECAEIFALREKLFDDKYLGEKHGWAGIRKERKKAYLRKNELG